MTKPPKAVRAWAVVFENDIKKGTFARPSGASVFFKKDEALECRQTCGDGFSIIPIEIRPIKSRKRINNG